MGVPSVLTWDGVYSTAADPGFPRGGGASPKGGAPTHYLANFSRKLHENEEILGQRGGASLMPPLRSATTPPHPDLGWGTPILTWDGVAPCQEGWGYPHWEGWGYPLSARWGTVLRNVGRQTPVKTVLSPFLLNAGGKDGKHRMTNVE